MQQHIDLMDALINKSAATFHLPCAFDRTAVILCRTVPFYVSIGLKNSAKTTIRDSLFEKLNGIIETMLADHAKLDARVSCQVEHGPRSNEIGGHRLLHEDVLFVFGAELKRLHSEVGKGADVDDVH